MRSEQHREIAENVVAGTNPSGAHVRVSATIGPQGSGESRSLGAVAEGVELGSNILHVGERGPANWREIARKTLSLC